MSGVSLGALAESSLVFWQERKPRERKALALGAAAVIVALLYALVVDPAIRGREQLAKTLPSLRQQAAEMQALSRQAAQLAQAGAAAPPAPTREAIERSLSSKGLKAQSVVLDGGLTRVQLASVPFSLLLDWLDDAQKTARLSVIDASIVAQPAVDTVNATLTLQQQTSGGTLE